MSGHSDYVPQAAKPLPETGLMLGKTLTHQGWRGDESRRITVRIGNDVWIGTEAKILEGITIGDGAVIGMGSIVTKDVEPYAIYAGNPARCIRKRFEL